MSWRLFINILKENTYPNPHSSVQPFTNAQTRLVSHCMNESNHIIRILQSTKLANCNSFEAVKFPYSKKSNLLPKRVFEVNELGTFCYISIS